MSPETGFKIKMDVWQPLTQESQEIGLTAGLLYIKVNDWIVTKHYNERLDNDTDYAFVSAYPLATWLTSVWWRLLYEPCPTNPFNEKLVPEIWRLTHELTGAEDSFAWPPLRLIPDGYNLVAHMASSDDEDGAYSDAQYDGGRTRALSLAIFEDGFHDFIESVISHLGSLNHGDRLLKRLWANVQEERANPEYTLYRIMEARLGFDPNEGPEAFVAKLAEISKSCGREPIMELASAFSQEVRWAKTSPDSGLIFSQNEPGLEGKGLPACLDLPEARGLSPIDPLTELPWQAGQNAAQSLRQKLGFSGKALPTRKLADLFGLKIESLEMASPSLKHVTLAQPGPNGQHSLTLYLRDAAETRQRLALARLLGEYILCRHNPGSWLVSTFCSTWRQKFQRAFAAEFLCPSDSLSDYLRNHTLSKAAAHYGLSLHDLRQHLSASKSKDQEKAFAAYEEEIGWYAV
jgi:hypothetical protein